MFDRPIKKQGWLHSPMVDFLFIFSIPFILTILFKFNFSQDGYKKLIIFSFIFLSTGHNLAPIIFYFFNKQERVRIDKICHNFKSWLILSFAMPVIIMWFSFYFYVAGNEYLKILMFSLMGCIYFLWNLFHFAKQQFGILCIFNFLSASGSASCKYERKIQFTYCFILLGVIPALIWTSEPSIFYAFLALFSGDFKINIFESYFAKSYFYFVYAVIFFLIIIFTIFYKKSLPVFMQYLSILIQSVGIVTLPFFFALVVATTHWFQEIYLISHLMKEQGKKSLILKILMFIMVSIIGYYIIRRLNITNNYVRKYGEYSGMVNISYSEYLLYATLSGVLMGLNFAHFCTDRFVFKNRNWK